MLGKCANPSCNVPFRYLRGGKLFLVDLAPKPGDKVDGFDRHRPHRVTYFWLCDGCSSTMSVSVNHDGVAVVQPFQVAVGADHK
jgi:hypothetical protein